jgi:hypothetical protein
VVHGYYNIAVDATAVSSVSVVAAIGGDKGTALKTFLVSYAIGGPIVHWAHGNVGIGFASLGMRVATPVVLAYIACPGDHDDYDCFRSSALAFLVGMSIASVLDASALAYKKTESLSAGSGFRLIPTGTITAHGATLGIAALF